MRFLFCKPERVDGCPSHAAVGVTPDAEMSRILFCLSDRFCDCVNVHLVALFGLEFDFDAVHTDSGVPHSDQNRLTQFLLFVLGQLLHTLNDDSHRVSPSCVLIRLAHSSSPSSNSRVTQSVSEPLSVHVVHGFLCSFLSMSRYQP